MWVPLFLLVAAADGGVPSSAPPASTESEPPPQRRTLSLSSVSGAPEFRDVQSGASTTGAAPPRTALTAEEPATRIEVREPDPSFDAGVPLRAEARTGARNESGPPATAPNPTAASEATNQALLEQSKAQTEAMQALVAQQQAQEQARIAEQQARTDRAVAVQDVRDSLGGTMQALQTSGDWDSSSLSRASASLRRTAASATASGSLGEASRASEAASLVDAARSALTQRNSQQAQWYLTRAAQLLGETPAGLGY